MNSSTAVSVSDKKLHQRGVSNWRWLRIPAALRITTPIAVLLALLIVSLSAITRNSTSHVVEPPSNLLPGKQQFPSLANCEALHDGRFDCHTYVSGSRVSLMYDAVSNTILYTFISTPDQVLGDLMTAWGTPSGFARTDQAMIVFWYRRAAYLAPCSFQPRSPVKYVGYNSVAPQPSAWRGFVRQEFNCSTSNISETPAP